MKIPVERCAQAKRIVSALVVCAVCALAAAVPQVRAQDADTATARPYFPPERLAGEYGLWIGGLNGGVEVRWITRDERPGYLRVTGGGRDIAEIVTPAAIAHAASFEQPRVSELVLEYGAADDPTDRHETAIDLDGLGRRAPVRIPAPDSLFVVGDVHGEFETLITLLRGAGIIDEDMGWAAGRAHLVFLGDLMSRGDDVIRLLWYVHGLERQAENAGGQVHVVLGNHEIMVMLDDLRYVAPKELRIAELHGIGYDRLFDVRHSVLGRWLGSKPAIMLIGDVLLAHGGVSTDFLDYDLRTYDDSLATFMGEDLFYLWANPDTVVHIDSISYDRRIDFFFGETTPFWYRGYLLTDTLGASLSRVLRHFDASVHVVAHTPVPRIIDWYDRALIAVHPPRPATELLLLERDATQWRRYRYTLQGPPEQF